MISAIDIGVRREICARCPHPCEAFKEGQIDHSDPLAFCPVKWKSSWGVHGGKILASDPGPVTPSKLTGPSLIAKVRTLKAELSRWSKAGYKLAPATVRRTRLKACQSCEFYRARGNMGFGECKLCGCTRAKLWLASTRCPYPKGPKWGACIPSAGQ